MAASTAISRDLGRRLGNALRQRVDSGALPWTVLPDSPGIRSTALGGSEFTAQLSGNTGYISAPEALLPRRNIQVVRPDFHFTRWLRRRPSGRGDSPLHGDVRS